VELITVSIAVIDRPPERLSMYTGWPKLFVSEGAINLAAISAAPPGSVVMIRIGLVGHASIGKDCAVLNVVGRIKLRTITD
jgi:hypothetical protein